MHQSRSDRVFAALGVGFVVTSLLGVAFSGDLLGGPGVTASTAKYAASIAHPIPATDWIGAYFEMLAVGCFLAFAAWAVARIGDGVLAQFARLAAGAYAAVTVTSLGLLDAHGYLQGHDFPVAVARSLDAANKGTYVGSWFLTAFFLLAVGALALTTARRVLGWSTVGLGVLTLVTLPSIDNFGELTVLLFFAWVVVVSVVLARRPNRLPAVTAAQHA